MKVTRQLVIEVDRREVPVGTSVRVRVRDGAHRPVENATVDVGSRRTRTDSRGLCEVDVRSPGFWKLTARKSPTDRVSYRSTTGLIRAVPRSTLERSGPRLTPGLA
ncbi:hypothetical protein [Natrarchaeobaculum aegyptiacum]|uniref:Carboxypeptidase regulatory-like domain-containing protein n=1 Tax=Natrarchaeobaculum aegyptiacum TaxID=745377 RepID=A0A2Z2HVE2_9EURY|nr:hypothetical protein [Natrarchaeobaculum aegyptiacum]ARS91182.1 hypothetical protein B1756_16580 [Natrarchaeobaculum aegyptiacum]